MGKGRKAQPVQPGPPSKPLPAQGTGQQKRTPNSAFDAAAGNDIYEPEMVVGERQKNLGGGKYETQYEVKWKGYEKKHNTYEPLSNLAGCEDMVAEYKERKRQRDAELEAEEREKKRQKQEDADAERKRLADESHTGEAIEAKTETALDCAEVSGLKHERLFFPVSDNGANMVAGWEPFGGGRCGVHTGQLSVMVFLEHQAIKPTREAKQYLAAPFSSGGVERVFSAAGKMHDDLRKSEKDSTLEHSLFAAFNIE